MDQKNKILISLFVLALVIFIINRKTPQEEIDINDPIRFIAHAGGAINGYSYTNSLEALNESYKKGFRLFELDIIKTKDNHFVAAHDWKHWKKQTEYNGNLPVDLNIFLKYNICSKYTPLDMSRINQWFKEHPDATLVTDKVNTPKEFSSKFIDKSRLMMELFTYDALVEGLDADIKSAMANQGIINNLTPKDRVSTLLKLGVTDIAISRTLITDHPELLLELKDKGIRAYAFHLNRNGIDEEYVIKNELNYIFGIYADKWNLNNKQPIKTTTPIH
jgi:hypothetical protein